MQKRHRSETKIALTDDNQDEKVAGLHPENHVRLHVKYPSLLPDFDKHWNVNNLYQNCAV
jgi:hypothetical protein